MGHPFEILLVDDSPADIRIMEEALNGSRVSNRLHYARDGVESLQFLRREGPFQHAPRPDLILLDLNMPHKGGLEVLAAIKADPKLRQIPTIILTAHLAEGGATRAYNLQANGFVVKPVDFDDFIAVVGGIEEYWHGVVRLSVPTVA